MKNPTTTTVARPLGQVRREACSLCGAPACSPCQASPPADHLRRWLDAYAAWRISRADMTAVIVALVVVNRWQVVPEVAA